MTYRCVLPRVSAVLAALSALLVSAAAVCAETTPDSPPGTAAPAAPGAFLPTWKADAQPLYLHGMGRIPGTNTWTPGNLPRGRYVLANVKGDQATLIETVPVDVRDEDWTRLYLFVPMRYDDVVAIPERDLRPVIKAFPASDTHR